MAITSQYSRVMWRGEPMTARQRQALWNVEQFIHAKYPKAHPNFKFVVPQGSWQPATTYSGTSHTGAGVVDLFFDNMTDSDWFHHVLFFVRKVGKQAAFGRGPWCKMPYHLHVCDLDTHGMSSSATWQVDAWRQGDDGLVYQRNDPFPWRPPRITKWVYKK